MKQSQTPMKQFLFMLLKWWWLLAVVMRIDSSHAIMCTCSGLYMRVRLQDATSDQELLLVDLGQLHNAQHVSL